MWFGKTWFSCGQKFSSHVNSFNKGMFSKIPSGNEVILHLQNSRVPILFNPSNEFWCNFGENRWKNSLCSFLFSMKVLSGMLLKVGFGEKIRSGGPRGIMGCHWQPQNISYELTLSGQNEDICPSIKKSMLNRTQNSKSNWPRYCTRLVQKDPGQHK